MKPENLRFWTIHIKHLSDVPGSRNWQNFTQMGICQILYKPEILRFHPIPPFIFPLSYLHTYLQRNLSISHAQWCTMYYRFTEYHVNTIFSKSRVLKMLKNRKKEKKNFYFDKYYKHLTHVCLHVKLSRALQICKKI